jgi:hypothetical protein
MMNTTTRIMMTFGLLLALLGCSDKKPGAPPPAPAPAPEPSPPEPAGATPTAAVPGAGLGTTEQVPVASSLSPEQAQALLSAAASEGQKPTADCTKIMEAVNAAAALVGPSTPENQQAFLHAAVCAERGKRYPLMLWAAAALAKANPETLKLAIIPRAFMHLDRPKEALAALKEIDKRYPEEPGVLFAGMLLANDQNRWDMVLKLADKTVDKLAASQFKSVAWEAEVLRAKALLTTARWPEVEASLAAARSLGAPPPVLEMIAKKLIPVRQNLVYVDPDVPERIYLGTYHLYGKAERVGEMFTVEIANLTGADQSMKVEIEIPGITDRTTRTVNVLQGGHERVALTPPLATDFQPAAQQAERNAQVSLRVTLADGKIVFDETIKTRLYPRDQLPLADNAFIPAWITPQAPAVEALLSAAKKRAPAQALPGKLAPTLPQVKALYDELKARGMSYVLVTNFGVDDFQHTRLPADTIASTNALCLDGTVLFAALAEKLGLRPVLVRVPGHIFFGWRAEPADKAPPGHIFFLETTMVGTHEFEEAFEAGRVQFDQQIDLGGFKTGQASTIDVLELRGLGITPQPWG